MNDTTETIRNQMEETKTHLSEKLESLEQQVSETVLSTGTAVNATVEAVQETVETVTEAVQGAVESVTNAFDIRHQIDRHPLLCLGGAAVLGYLAREFLTKRVKKVTSSSQVVPLPTTDGAGLATGTQAVEPAAIAAAIAAAYKSGWENSVSTQLKGQALVGLTSVVQGVISQALPVIIDCLTGQGARNVTPASEPTSKCQESASQEENETAHQVRF